MEWSKIKNIAILILLIVNGVLLAMVGTQLSASARYQEGTRRQAVAALERNGITVMQDTLPDDLALPVLSVTRDRDAEAGMVRALLGESVHTTEHSGGIRRTYTSAVGSADFYSSGRFTFTLDAGAVSVGEGSPASHASQTMERLGITGTQTTVELQGDRAEVVFRQLWDEVPLFDCTVRFSYESGSLRAISGGYLSGTVTATGGTVEMTTATALLRFLSGRNENGFICSQLTGIRAGYRLSTGRPVDLTPVWYFTTDTQSDYVLDAATGALSRAD